MKARMFPEINLLGAKMSRKILLLFFALTLMMAFSANVFALGITPGRTTLDFSPGEKRTLEVTVINSDSKDVTLVVFLRGELNQSIALSESKFHMSSKEKERKLKFDFSFPGDLSPGLHTVDVVVMESAESGQSASPVVIGAALAVATQVSVYVPYPGKYAEAVLVVSGNNEHKKFVISAIGRGKEGIDKMSANIEIYDGNGKRIKKLDTNSVSLPSGEKKEVTAEWNVDAPLGEYIAKAVLDYDGSKVLLEKEFEVGDLLLDLVQIFVKDFTLGGVAKFNMVVKNKWSEPITNAYAEMRIYDKDLNELDDLKSSTYDIPPGLQTTMVYYWDTKNILEGLYNANVILYYAGKKTQQDLKLDVGQNKIDVIGLGYVISSEESSGNGSLTTILIIVVGFLVLVNIAWFLMWRKRHK